MVCKKCSTESKNKDNLRPKCGTSVLALIFLLVTCLGFGTGCSAKKDTTETIVSEENGNVVLEDEINNEEESNNEPEPVTDENSANGETSNQNETEQESAEGKYDELQNGNYEELAHSLKTGEKVQSSHREIMMSMLNALLADQKIGCDEKICFNQLSGEESQYYARSIIKNNMLQTINSYKVDDTNYILKNNYPESIYNNEEITNLLEQI